MSAGPTRRIRAHRAHDHHRPGVRRALAAALFSAFATMFFGACSEEEWCPERFDEVAPRGGLAWCTPTDYAFDAVKHLRTGVWGFALGCRKTDDEDTCDCDVEARAGCQTVLVSGASVDGKTFMSYWHVLEDGFFLFEAEPGVEYRPAASGHRLTTETGNVDILMLEEGQVLFARLIVRESC